MRSSHFITNCTARVGLYNIVYSTEASCQGEILVSSSDNTFVTRTYTPVHLLVAYQTKSHHYQLKADNDGGYSALIDDKINFQLIYDENTDSGSDDQQKVMSHTEATSVLDKLMVYLENQMEIIPREITEVDN